MTRPVWTWTPDWSTPVIEHLLWMTDIQTSRDGTEERQRIRQIPRRTLQFSTVVDGYQAQRLDAMLWGKQLEGWLMPLWWDASRLTSDSDSDGNTLTVHADTSNRDFRGGGDFLTEGDGGWIVLLDPKTGRHHASEIRVISGEEITLFDPPADVWPAGSLIYPARIVHLSPSQVVRRETAGVITADVTAEVVDTQAMATSQDADGDGGTRTIQSIPVFDRVPNRAQAIDANFERLVNRVDFDIGPFSFDDRADRPFIGRTHEHLIETRADLWTLRQWLERCAGRLEDCWASTEQMDLTLTRPTLSGDTSIFVRRIDYSSNYAGQLGRDYIAIRSAGGGMVHRHITASTVIDDAEEELTLDKFVGGDHSTDIKISWLERVRLASDAIEIQHLTAEVSTIALPFRTLR